MAKASEARTIVSIFQQDRRTYQNLSARPDTTAKGLCDRAISQFDLVQLSRRELVRDGRSFGLFHLPASGGEMPVPDNENLLDFMRRCGEQKPKFAFLMRDTRDFLFLKEKHVSIDAAIPPSPKAVTPAKDAQGWLRKKKEGKQWKKRWVKLVGTNLQYQKDPRDREPLGSLPLTECSLSFKVLSGLRTIIIARFDKAKPNARPTVFLFCADKESTGLSVDEWYASIYARINPISGGNTLPKSLSSSASAPALLSSPPPIAASPPASSGTIYLNSTAKKEGVNLTMRERAMCCWINTLCARKKIPVASIGSELDNGIVLMAISELGFKQRITARYATDITAMTWEQKLSNLAIAMDALRTAGARFSPIAPQVFIDGHKALIMQFIWEVIVSFHIRGATANIKDAMNEDSFRRQLLEKTQFYIGITQDAQVTNFTSSFADGFAFCYIVERFKPGVIDFREIVKEKPRENLKAAFAVAANAGMPPCISPYEFGDGVDELAVVIWLCMWFDLMDAARKAFFEPLPVVPVSQRVLMDKLMDGKDNPREIMAVMREISQNEKNRKVYQTQKEMNNTEAERLKREELARLRQETEAERMSNLQAIVSAVTNKDKDKEEEEREPEVDEEENFRRQQMIIKAQYEKYQAVQQRLLESTRGSSMGGELTPAPTAAPAATFAPSNLQDDSLERRMIEEFGSDEEIYDVTAELQNLDSMLGDLETTANTASPAAKRESEARREVDDLFAWEDDPSSSSNNSSTKSSARIDKKTLDPKRSTVDRVIDEQIRAIEAIRLKEQSGPSLLSSPPARNSSGEQAQRERRSTATKAELESTVNEVEAFLTALTARRASNVSANQAKAAALAAATAMQQPLSQHSPYISLSSPSAPSLSTAPSSSSYSAATATYSQLPSSSYSTPSSTTFTPSIAPPPSASAPPMNHTVAALSASSPRKNSNPFEDDAEAAILPSKPKPAALTKSIDMPVGIFHLKNSTADTNFAVPASPPPPAAATSLSSYPAPVSSPPPPVPLFSAPSPPRSPPYEPPVVPPPLPPFVSMPSPLRDAPPPPHPPLSPRAAEPSSPRDYPKIHPPPAPAFSVPPLADMEPPPPLPAPPAPLFTAPPLAASTPPTASMKASLAALAAFEDSFAAFDLEEPKSRALLVQSGPATAAPSTIITTTVPPPPTAAAPPPPPPPSSSSSSTTTSTSSKRDDFGDLDAQFAALTASLNSLAADATFATRPKVAATLPSNPTPPPAAPAVNVVPSSPQPRSASPSLPANASNPLQPPRSVSPAREKGGVAAIAAAFAARNETVNSSTPQSIPSPREREVSVSASILALSFSSSSSSSSPATFSPPAPQNSSKPASSALSSSLSVLPSVNLSPASTTSSAPSSAPPLSTSQPIPARSLAPSAASFSSAAVPPSRSFSPSPTSATPPNAFYGRRAGDSPPKSPNPAGGPLLPSGSSSTSSPSPSPSSTNPWMAKINAMPGKINSPFFKNKAEAKPADGAAKNEPQKSPIRAGIVAANNNPNNNGGGGGPTSPRSPRSVSPSSATAPKDEPHRTVKPAAKPMPVVMAPSGGAADLLFGDDTPSGGAPFALKKDNDLDKAMADLLS